VVLFAVAAHFQYFELMRVMSTGGSNEPYMPAPHMLVLFAAMGACAAWLWFRWKRSDLDDTMTAVIVVSIPALASALGRCDSGHVFWGAVGILAPGWMLLSRGRARRWMSAGFVLSFAVLPLPSIGGPLKSYGKAAARMVFSGKADQRGVVARGIDWAAGRALGHEAAEKKLAIAREAANLPETIDFAAIYPGAGLMAGQAMGAPLTYLPNSLSEYEGSDVHEGRYFGLQNVLTPAQMQVKVDELEAHPEWDLLMPKSFPDNCAADPTGGIHWLRRLFVFPYMRRPRHTENLAAPLCEYVQREYREVAPAAPENFGYSLWVRR
jgi:hypothetical protein